MDIFLEQFAGGLSLLLDPAVLLAIAFGTLGGIFLGALPGVGIPMAFAIVLPFTFSMPTTAAVALFIAILAGAMFGNGIPAILLGVPGTPASLLTAIDGYALRRQGKASLAMGTMWMASSIGQFTAAFFFTAAVIPLAAIAYTFLQPEMFALYLFAIIAIISLTGKNMKKGLIAAALGFAVGFVGTDPVLNVARFTFGNPELRDGLSLPVVLIGVLAVSEILRQMRQVFDWRAMTGGNTAKIKFPPFRELRPALRPTAIGVVIGAVMGALPGAGATSAALISYQQAKVFSKRKDEFGKGSVEGVGANEAAQNAAAAGEMIPTLGLGIPGSATMVFVLAAITMHGFIPGPLLTREAPELLWAAIAAMLGGAVVIIVAGWGTAKVVGKALSVNRSVVLVVALMLTCVGIFTINFKWFDVVVGFLAGLLGYFMTRYGYSVAAFALAAVLGPSLESSLRYGLNLVHHDVGAFFSRPLVMVLVLAAVVFAVIGFRRSFMEHREGRRLASQPEPTKTAIETTEA